MTFHDVASLLPCFARIVRLITDALLLLLFLNLIIYGHRSTSLHLIGLEKDLGKDIGYAISVVSQFLVVLTLTVVTPVTLLFEQAPLVLLKLDVIHRSVANRPSDRVRSFLSLHRRCLNVFLVATAGGCLYYSAVVHI